MSYGMAAALQAAVYGRLAADAGVQALVGGAVFDTAPPGPLPPLYVVLGAEDVQDRSDFTGRGAVHELVVSVVSDGGFAGAKAAAAAVADALVPGGWTLERGRLVSLSFLRAAARQAGQGRSRRIDLRFRARVEDD